jgi:single-stranded-DNA-specific exonuclease
MQTIEGKNILLLSDTSENIEEILMHNRRIRDEDREIFFAPSLTGLHDPYLLPDMDRAVGRIIEAKKKHERIIIFGDYDVDGVSSTALLVRFLTEIGCQVS